MLWCHGAGSVATRPPRGEAGPSAILFGWVPRVTEVCGLLGTQHVSLGSGVAVACRRCGPRPQVSYLATEEVKDVLDRAHSAGPAAAIVFSGPEPFGHPDLHELIAHAVRAGFPRLGLRTSGAPLAEDDRASECVTQGVRFLEVEMLGGLRESHDDLSGATGSFDAAFAGIAKVRAVAEAEGIRFALRGRVPICRHTLQESPGIVAALARAGVSSVELACPPSLASAAAIEWLCAACDTGTVNGVWVAVSGVEPSSLGASVLHSNDILQERGVAS